MSNLISTTIPNLDLVLSGGLRPGDLTVIGGRPNTGKSTFACNIAEGLSVDRDSATGIFTLGEPLEKWASGPIQRHQERNSDVLGRMLVDYMHSLSTRDVCARARALKAQYGINLVLIDYLEVLGDDDELLSPERRYDQLHALKHLAIQLDIPIVILASLKRLPLERRANKRPIVDDFPSHLGAAVMQCADTVLLMYRDGLYNDEAARGNISELSIVKHWRETQIAPIYLQLDPSAARFSSVQMH